MDLINKYIKKPVEIEAMQYIPGDDIRQAAIDWIGESCRHTFMDDSGCLQESLPDVGRFGRDLRQSS